MGESYLRNKVDDLRNLEPTMKRHAQDGLWEMIARKTIPNYVKDEPGLIFIFKVLWQYNQQIFL